MSRAIPSTDTSTKALIPVPTGELSIPDLLTQPKEAVGSFSGMPQPLRLSLVIPTYNESNNVSTIVEQLTTLLDSAIPGKYELILVDDDSPDKTWKVAHDLSCTYPQLRVMRRQQERGLSSAVIRGWQVAQGEILGVIDGDLQHPPEVLLDMLSAVANGGSDLAVASRHVDGGGVSDWSLMRRFLSRGAQLLGLLILPNVVGRVTDPMSGYFMVQRRSIQNRILNPKGYKILLEVIGRGQIDTIAEVGYVFQERTVGESKVTWRQYVDYLHHLMRLRSRQGITHLRQQFPIKRFLRFGVVGFSGVFVDMAVLYLLHSLVGLPLTRSKILAGEVAILNNFIWNDAWTFSDVVQQQQGWGARLGRFLKFNLICLSGLILNVLVLNILYNVVFGQRYAYLANLLAIAVVTLWNFWLNLKLSWRVTKVK
ncbi:MAG: glycosyltransferase [Cyanobacteria bacterium J06642_11]